MDERGVFIFDFKKKEDFLLVINELEDYPYEVRPLDKNGNFVMQKNVKRKEMILKFNKIKCKKELKKKFH